MNNHFSENLKKIRKEHNLSQEQLADELGVSRQAISKWESALAYPEMDKIIFLCNKFNLNIDDLLHKDINEAKGEKESKNKINSLIDDFLNFITNTINLFTGMNTKSKIRCLFEQFIIIIILFIASLLVVNVLNSLFISLFSFLPYTISRFVNGVLYSILILACIAMSIIIVTHIFKIRYLDYYDKIKVERKKIEESRQNNENTQMEESEEKIVIRDPKHSEYKFINGLFKLIILMIKFFLLEFCMFVAFSLVFLFVGFILSFLLIKTGFFFIGILISIISASTISVVILLLILNFVFNRKSNIKKMIYSFILSLITFGIGIGLIFVGTLDFEVLDYNESMLTTFVTEHDMSENLLIYRSGFDKIEYVESDNNNVKIEYTLNKYCKIDEFIDGNNHIMPSAYCDDPTKIAKEFIKNVNNKKIIPFSNTIEKITVYTSKSNIEKLKENFDNYLEQNRTNEEKINAYEKRINDLESENNELKAKLSDDSYQY